MKKALSVAALALAMTGSALAADLPHYKAPPPPPPPPPPLWTGFYVGLNAGGTWANSNSIRTVAAPIPVANPGINPAAFGPLAAALAGSASSYLSSGGNGGFIGGGQIGYNWQFYNSFVAGVEADIQGIAGTSGTQTAVAGAPVIGFPGEVYFGVSSARRSVDYIGTVRGRVGWLFTPTLLLYGTGGLAYGGVSLTTSYFGGETPTFAGFAPAFGGTSFSDTRVGWTAGGGLEWMFWPNWSAKVEYLYYDLGNVTTSSFIAHSPGHPLAPGVVAAAATQTTTRFNGNIVRVGLNYHFNWGAAPIVAKY
jgi:outer membrane immunogenic protein